MVWQFNKQVASEFGTHARQHIPDYNKVLELSLDLCHQRLDFGDAILEIGCAIGETVDRLNNAGYTNIHAVDSSQAMLDHCPAGKANYYCSSEYPDIDIKFDMVLCNWTLHFIENKQPYLKKIFSNMKSGAVLVLSEKTENKGYALEQYHIYKSRQGVSHEQIKLKEQSLKGVMFPLSVENYLALLKETGFSEIYIASANWCFTTFVVIK